MSNRRLVALLLALQLLALLLLTQTWFSISILINGKKTVLGDFDATQSYAISMSSTLLLLAMTLVIFLVSAPIARILLGFSTFISLALGVWLVPIQASSKNISELDGQLARLTGIAKTHGVTGLEIEISFTPWLWFLVSLLAALLAGYLSVSAKGWVKALTPNKGKGKSANPTSAIDLWDAQRD